MGRIGWVEGDDSFRAQRKSCNACRDIVLDVVRDRADGNSLLPSKRSALIRRCMHWDDVRVVVGAREADSQGLQLFAESVPQVFVGRKSADKKGELRSSVSARCINQRQKLRAHSRRFGGSSLLTTQGHEGSTDCRLEELCDLVAEKTKMSNRRGKTVQPILHTLSQRTARCGCRIA